MKTEKSDLNERLNERIGYGLYGGIEQFYIKGVDGSLAQLGNKLPCPSRLAEIVDRADADHRKRIKTRTFFL